MKLGDLAQYQLKNQIAWVVIAAILAGAGSLWAQEDTSDLLEVSRSAICPQIVNRQPVNKNTRYLATVGKVYCYSRISNIETDTRIQHVWYFNNTESARVVLPVKPPSWRTYSSKWIMPHQTGRWRVDILDNEGNVLKTLGFDIAP